MSAEAKTAALGTRVAERERRWRQWIDTAPHVMGVLNVTPDSFSDGGELHRNGRVDRDRLRRRASAMRAAGATALDIGGESTRPDAVPPSPGEEADRVLPALECLVDDGETVLSVDTSNPALMRQAAELGADMINDVRALRRNGALQAVAESGMPACLMHMQGEPDTMQHAPDYPQGDVVSAVRGFLAERVSACERAGIDRTRLMVDPGFGFGKTPAHNLALLRAMPRLVADGLPVMLGVSRKSTIGALLRREVHERLAGALALSALAVWWAASIIRTHDVAETVDAVRITRALIDGERR